MSDFVRICSEGELPPAGALQEFMVSGRPLCVANVQGKICVLDGTCPHEGGPLDELFTPAGPQADLSPGMRRAIEEVKTSGVADGPTVEVAAPAVHLNRGDARRVVDERRQHACLVPACLPQRSGQIVIASEALGAVQ